MSYDEAIECCIEQGLSQNSAEIKVTAGVNDYKPWTLSELGSGLDRWNDCIKSIRNVNGEEEVNNILKLINE